MENLFIESERSLGSSDTVMQLAENHYRIAVLGCAALLMILLGSLRFCGEFDLPGKPPRPAVSIATAKSVSETIKLSSAAYDSYLKEDAADFGLAPVRARVMSAVFPYRSDRERRVLEIDETVEVLGMSMTLTVEKVKGSKRKHMVLRIENKGHKPLAYRVKTRPSAGARSCKRMSQVPHNAMALPAGGASKRAECVFRKGWTLEITEVETMALPELGYLYLSSMSAEGIGLEPRTAKRHKVPHSVMSCRAPTSATMRNALKSGKISWRDQVDFYARHRCKTYKFPYSYQAFRKDGELSLPVSADDL